MYKDNFVYIVGKNKKKTKEYIVSKWLGGFKGVVSGSQKDYFGWS